MKKSTVAFLVVLGFASVLVRRADAQTIANQTSGNQAIAMQGTDDKLIAIDVLLEPDGTMVEKSNGVNARLRGNYPAGYALDATHAPHVTLLQRFVRAKDLDAVTTALTKVFATEHPTELQLQAKGHDYAMWGGVAVTIYVVELTPELKRLHQKVIDAVEPFSVSSGNAEAFVGTGINAETINWVEHFVPESSGTKYLPHVTLGVAHEDFVKQLKAEPSTSFTFKADGVAIYQLGNFGTAAKKLWEYQPKPLASWNDGPAKQSILRVRPSSDNGGQSRFRSGARTHRHLRQRRHALVRATATRSGILCTRPGESPGATASRMEDHGAIRLVAQR